MQVRYVCIGLLMGVAAVGCGPSGPATTEITGKVTFNGTAIDDGDITFLPEQGGGTTSSGVIAKGEYKLSGQSGLLPGTYGVRINAFRPGAKNTNPDMPPDPNPKTQFLPDKFNTRSTIAKVVVESGKTTMKQDFDLK